MASGVGREFQMGARFPLLFQLTPLSQWREA